MSLQRIDENMLDKKFVDKVNNNKEEVDQLSLQLAQTEKEVFNLGTTTFKRGDSNE